MKLVAANDPVLTKKCEEFNFVQSPFDPIEFSKDLVKFMYENNAISLTANQIGKPYRIFAMRGSPENFVCFNPRIVTYSDQEVVLEESSITYPGLIVKVKRPQHVRVRFMLPNADTRTETFTGVSARVFQQSLDTLSGIVYYNRANKYHRDKAFRKVK